MKMVDINTIVVSGIDMKDYPKFCDAYIESAEYDDGTPLTEEELETFQQCNWQLLHDKVMEDLF